MKIIPVIDYMQGSVVLAEKGDRSKYHPVKSKLCNNSNLNSVINNILSIANFSTIYIADLDSIEKQSSNKSWLPQICALYPEIEFWCDIGAHVSSWNSFMNNTVNARPIIGSESFSNTQKLTLALQEIKNFRPLLSIDINNGKPLGPIDLLTNFYRWPDEIIVLLLNRVGSAKGPDFSLIRSLVKQIPDCKLYVGGGTRNINDIQQLKLLGFSGVLVAKSLHEGTINSSDLAEIMNQ